MPLVTAIVEQSLVLANVKAHALIEVTTMKRRWRNSENYRSVFCDRTSIFSCRWEQALPPDLTDLFSALSPDIATHLLQSYFQPVIRDPRTPLVWDVPMLYSSESRRWPCRLYGIQATISQRSEIETPLRNLHPSEKEFYCQKKSE